MRRPITTCAACGKRIVGQAQRIYVSATPMIGRRVHYVPASRNGQVHRKCLPWFAALAPTPTTTIADLGFGPLDETTPRETQTP